MKIDNIVARKYNLAEYFFDEDASTYFDLVEAAIDEIYNKTGRDEDRKVGEAFTRYLAGEKVWFSTGICGNLTAGFGKVSPTGYFDYPLPTNFVKSFLESK